MAKLNQLFSPNYSNVDRFRGFVADATNYKRGIAGAVGPKGYLRTLDALRGETSDIFGNALDASFAQASGRQASLRAGVASPLAGFTGISPELMSLAIASDYAKSLHGLQGVIAAGGNVPGNESILSGAAQGAVQGGLATGSPFGALAGAVGGGIATAGANKAKNKARARITDALAQASPEAFAKRVEAVLPAEREAALAAGTGQLRAQALESAISSSGLRGTGLGVLASIAAGVQPELAGLQAAFAEAMKLTEARVSHLLGQPVSAPNDRIARALEGLATATASGLFNRNSQPDYSNAPAPQGQSYAGPGDLNTLGQ